MKSLKILFLPLFAIMGGGVAFLVHQQTSPIQHQQTPPDALPVHYLPMETVTFSPRVSGFGTVAASELLTYKAEVSGTVSWVSDQLAKGQLIEKDTLLVRLEPTDIQLLLEKANAELSRQQAEWQKTQQSERNTRALRPLVEQRLKLAQAELKRQQTLLTTSSIARSAVDKQLTQVLATQQELTNIDNELALYPSRKDALTAAINVAKAQVAEQQRNLARTEIRMPFTGRIHSADLEPHQRVGIQEPLFSAIRLDSVEIALSLTPNQVLALMSDMTTFSPLDALSTPLSERGILAQVQLSLNHNDLFWPAHLIRIEEELDPITRAIDFIVAVDNPYQTAEAGIRPPLLPGMYVEVSLFAPPVSRVVIPRSSLQQNQISLLNSESLSHQALSPDFRQQDWWVLPSNWDQHASLITTDLLFAPAGTRLSGQIDTRLKQERHDWAQQSLDAYQQLSQIEGMQP